MDVLGDIAQQEIWDVFFRHLDRADLIEIIEPTVTTRKRATDIASQMRWYWERLPNNQGRPHKRYFPEMLERICDYLDRAEDIDPTTTPRAEMLYVGGRSELNRILRDVPEFKPIGKTTGGSFEEVTAYVADITTGVSTFIYVEGNATIGYIASTDVPIPREAIESSP